MVEGEPLSGISAVIYTRVSTDEQAVSGLGLEAQLEACRRHCAAKGMRVTGEFTDPGVSGREDPASRTGFAAAWAALQSLFGGVLVVSALSRLTRRQSALWALLDERGPYALRLQSASEPFDTSTAMGRAMVGMLGVWAQLEADMISDRTKAALAARRARGLRVGPVPIGETRPEVVEAIRRAYSDENKGYAAIAYELNLSGVPGPRGGKWYRQSVRRVIQSLAAPSVNSSTSNPPTPHER